MSVDYTVVLHPTINNFVIKQGSGNEPTLLDVDWRGVWCHWTCYNKYTGIW